MTKNNILSMSIIIMMLFCIGISIFYYSKGLTGWVLYYIFLLILSATMLRGHFKYNY